jgi:hypothetical protein
VALNSQNLIKIALDMSDAAVKRVAVHEAWHSIEPLLTPGEVATLNAAYPPTKGRSQTETVAYAFEDWNGDRFSAKHTPAAKSIFARIARFLKALGNMLRGRGLVTADSIFEAARTGEIGQRTQTDVPSSFASSVYNQTLPTGEQSGNVPQFRTKPPDTRPSYVAPPAQTSLERALAGAHAVAVDPAARSRFWLKVKTDLINRLEPVKDAEIRRNLARGGPGILSNAQESASKLAAMAMDDSGRMMVAMTKAPFVWDAKAGIARPHKTIGGLADVFGGLKNQADYDNYQRFAYATRAQRLLAEGRERLMSPADIAQGLALKSPLFDATMKKWQAYNDAMLQFAVDTGVLTPEAKAIFTQHSDYVPFYRVYEETGEVMGPSDLRTGLSNPSLKIKTLKGGEAQLGDLYDNIVRNTATVASAGLRNVAMGRIHNLLGELGEATDVPHWQNKGDGSVSYYQDGKRVWFKPHDQIMFTALAGMRPEQVNSIVKGLHKISAMYRTGITASPPFILRNWIRGILGTWVQTGRNLSTTGNTVTGMKAYWKDDPIVDMIRTGSGFGGYAFGEAGGMQGRHLRRLTTDHRTLIGRAHDAWMGWERIGESTEMADRIALAQSLLAAGETDAEAVFQAGYVLPYSQHGAAPWVRFLTLTVPFLNARLQGFARMLDTTTSADERGRLMKRIILRGLVLSGFTAALWALNNGDDDSRKKYEAMPLDQRLTYWPVFLGDKAFMIPKPFEFGHVFGTAIEMALDSASKDTGVADAGALALAAAQQTFGFDTYLPLPQALVPAAEVATNYDFFRKRPVENLGVSRLPHAQRTGVGVSATAEVIAGALPDFVQASPLQVDHLINGYFGLMGKTVTATIDAAFGALGVIPQRPSGIFGGSVPAAFASAIGLDALVKDVNPQQWNRWVDDFYSTKQLADQAMAGARDLALRGDIQGARELIADNRSLLALRPTLTQADNALSTINAAMRKIRSSGGSPDEQRRKLDPLTNQRNEIASRIMKIYNRAQAQERAA